MTLPTQELMAKLSSIGARVRIHDGQLWVKAPKGVITEELQAAIAERKAELMAMLRTYPCVKCLEGIFSTPFIVCFKCRKTLQETAS